MCASFSAPTLRRTAAARLAAVTLATGLVAAGVLTAAGPAAADDTPQNQGGATATMGGLKTFANAVVHDDGADYQVSAGLFEMSVDGGGTLQTYCTDLHNPTQRDAKYHETPWSGTSLGTNRSAGKIRWIVQHSYPQVNDLAALATKAGVANLSEQDAAAGTQVAIWRYSDGARVDAVDPQAEKLADYLQRSARDLPEPAASLILDPPAVSGHPGERVGPVTVHTGAGSVSVTPPVDAADSGVRIVGADGRPVTSAADGSRIYFQVPKEPKGGSSSASGAAGGTAELTVQGSTTVPVGRAFTSDSRSQTQILAGSSESTVSATASATWAGTGAIPALSAAKDCVRGGLAITATNKGDAPFAFRLMGVGHSIAPGASQRVLIPLREDQAYDFTITGPQGFGRRFAGVLDCRTQGGAGGTTTQTLSEPAPATVGGTAAGTNLAETGGTSTTPLIAATGLSLLVLGATALSIVRKKRTPTEN
ncbi:Cys-Gln thioester bond-forming surface protein [Streptomyces tropicalis]|uniref:Cys-Gln thioester bond-forming surface protein n=1 Tax=Streptomyces tropicalis TaxID=3034234 RepID=A0ABT5ZZE5_9ACTN|nr:Cys-Gln thioester bond-forming surface protein [Streptomyces tropicalis]MDF3297577.1 Cys-Gln thioester bond-forming surface protein [Streptomyces tropicalis]